MERPRKEKKKSDTGPGGGGGTTQERSRPTSSTSSAGQPSSRSPIEVEEVDEDFTLLPIEHEEVERQRRRRSKDRQRLQDEPAEASRSHGGGDGPQPAVRTTPPPQPGWRVAREASPTGDASNAGSSSATKSAKKDRSRRARTHIDTEALQQSILDRTHSMKVNMEQKACEMFCLTDCERERAKWRARRMRMLARCGKLKKSAEDEYGTLEEGQDESRQHYANVPRDYVDGGSGPPPPYSAATSIEQPTSFVGSPLKDEPREPVYAMTLKGIVSAKNMLSNRMKKSEPQPEPAEQPPPEPTYAQVARAEHFHPSGQVTFRVQPDVHDHEAPAVPTVMLAATGRAGDYSDGELQELTTAEQSPGFRQSVSSPPRGKRLVKKKPVKRQESVRDAFSRKFSLGFLDGILNRKAKKGLSRDYKLSIDHHEDSRPFFTYWITTVQIVVLFISILVYGFGEISLWKVLKSEHVLVTSLSRQQVEYYESPSIWIGPKPTDLIHLGAKFTPCMRWDRNVQDKISQERAAERQTACCVRNDGSGCVQSTRERCSKTLSTFVKWTEDTPGPDFKHPNETVSSRLSGSVCGQDPRYCSEPPSRFPYAWSDDVTKWPICRSSQPPKIGSEDSPHMTCDIVGRPCCIGIYGECRITTREYCDFVTGTFHTEAALCSQVSCMSDVCGMIPFWTADQPDQFARLLTPIFLHGGVIHLIITVGFQIVVLANIERFVGSIRLMVIYFGAGIGGYLLSSYFVPYRPDVGPSGAHFGIIALLMTEVWNNWSLLDNPKTVLMQYLAVLVVLLLFGFLPWVDNFAHFGGFITGGLLSLALLPYMTISGYDKKMKKLQIWISISLVSILFIGLFILFYAWPLYRGEAWRYFSCLGSDWCEDFDIKIKRSDVL